MGTITNTVLQHMERFRQKQINLDELTQPRWEKSVDYYGEQDKKYSTSEMRVPAVVWQQTNDDALAPPLKTFREHMQSPDIVPGISQRLQGTSRPGSSHNMLGSVKPQSTFSIPGGEPAAEPNSSALVKAKPVKPVTFYPRI
jgi:hypothetical protein